MDRVTFGKKTKEYIEKGLFVRGNEFVRTPNIIGLKRDDDLFYIYKTNELGEVIVEAITEDKNFAYILVCDELGIELSLKDQLRLSRELFNIIATRTSSVKIVDENIDDNKVDDKVYRFVYNDMQYKDQKWKLKSTKYYDEIEAPSNLTQDEFYEFISILVNNIGDIRDVYRADALVELLEFYGIYKSSPCEIANRKTVDLDLHTNRFNSKYSKKTKLSSEFATDDVSISAYGKTFNDEWYDMSLRDINRLVELKNKIEDNELRLALK